MNIVKKIFFLVVLIASLNSCRQIITPPKPFYCPPLQQNCFAEKWSGVSVDTSESFKKVADTYYTFQNLKRLNSPEDEWGLSFIDPKKAILTFNDDNEQRVMVVKMGKYDAGWFESGIGVPVEGSIGAISVKDNHAVFAVAPQTSNPDNVTGNSDIYTADLQGNILVNPKNLKNFIGTDQYIWESMPSYSRDRNVIFFVSDRQKYFGTEILFMIKMPDGSWSEPLNCGDSVNSNCDELCPYVSNDGKTLLFSSCGHVTVGGYDIFSSKISTEFWNLVEKHDLAALSSRKDLFGKATNLRPPLNTPFDELFPSSPGDLNDVLYYSSNQSEGKKSIVFLQGGFDIFVRKRHYPEKKQELKTKEIAKDVGIDINVDESKLRESDVKFKLTPRYSIEGKIYNAKTGKVVPRADILVRKIQDPQSKVKEEIPDQNELELSSVGNDLFYDSYKLKADSSGDYKIELEKGKDYEITAQSDDLFFESFKIRIEKDDTTSIFKKDFFVPEQLTMRINFPSKVYDDPYKFTLDSNGVETNNLWEDEINNVAKNILLSKDKIKTLILIGHTDDVGTESANQKLGMDRVQFIINELVKRGIPQEILEGRSAGELKPLDQRTDEPIQMFRKRLRRVELQKILKT